MFPSDSLWGSINDAFASGLINSSAASTVASLKQTGLPLGRVEPRPIKSKEVNDIWAPHRLQMRSYQLRDRASPTLFQKKGSIDTESVLQQSVQAEPSLWSIVQMLPSA